MNKTPTRYNSGIQRSKGLMEVGAALYDTSLSHTLTRSGTTAPQINSRLGTQLELTDGGLGLSFGVNGFYGNLMQVANKEVSLMWINPAAPLAMAYRGCAPFPGAQPLRAIAVFPSWDAAVISVHESTGVTSIEQIRERRVPLRVSTGNTIVPPFDEDGTMFAIVRILAAAGITLDDIRAWGGSIVPTFRPSHPDRAVAIRKGEVNAVFDEGIMSWGQIAVENGFRFLPVQGTLADRIKADGYDIVMVTPKRIPALRAPVPSVDFCGWPMVVHADMEDAVAYALCEAIELRKDAIPTDNYRPLDLAQLCSGDEETPMVAPLHPGAERFYRERGYLRK
jgi:TRAP-type uncharacterized transport system substrate-binding protein